MMRGVQSRGADERRYALTPVAPHACVGAGAEVVGEARMSLVGFKAKNHPQQAVRDEVNDRRTPQAFFDALNERYAFTLDAAASRDNTKVPNNFCSVDLDGLHHSWTDERVWCNPPYTGLEQWVAKAWHEMRSGCELVVMLLPNNRCEQVWWQEHIEPYRAQVQHGDIRLRVEFLRGRMRFGFPGHMPTPKGGWRPPFGQVLVTWERVA